MLAIFVSFVALFSKKYIKKSVKYINRKYFLTPTKSQRGKKTTKKLKIKIGVFDCPGDTILEEWWIFQSVVYTILAAIEMP